MARITVEEALKKLEDRFVLVLVAATRARQLQRKQAVPYIPENNDKCTVIALREIESGYVGKEILDTKQDTNSYDQESQDISMRNNSHF